MNGGGAVGGAQELEVETQVTARMSRAKETVCLLERRLEARMLGVVFGM